MHTCFLRAALSGRYCARRTSEIAYVNFRNCFSISSMVSATEALQAVFKVSASEACRHAMGVPCFELDGSVLETASPRLLPGHL